MTASTMSAAVYTRYGTPNVLSIQSVKIPLVQPGEVLVRVTHSTVTSGDWRMLMAKPFAVRFVAGLTGPKHPVLGNEFAGEVAAIGEGVTQFKKGDKVFGAAGAGAHAEYLTIKADGLIVHLPNGIRPEEAAAVPNGGITALFFLQQAGIHTGQRVLIYGASGSVGSHAVQLAKYFGAHVTAVASTSKLDAVRSLGPDEVIDYKKLDFAKNGLQYDIIFDAAGKYHYSKAKGSLTSNGVFASVEIGAAPFWNLFRKMKPTGKRAFIGITPQRRESLIFLADLMASGHLRPLIGRRYPLSDIRAAYEHARTHSKLGNLIIEI